SQLQRKMEELAPVLGMRFARVVVATDRPKRPGESEGRPWYFKEKLQIRQFAENREHYVANEIRPGNLQGLDMKAEVETKLEKRGVLWCELHASWREHITDWVDRNMDGVTFRHVLLAPLTQREIQERMGQEGLTGEKVVEREMFGRLVKRRTAGLDSASDEKLRVRAQDAVEDLNRRDDCDCVIVNHQGEESPQWGAAKEFPTGEAGRVLSQFVQIYRS
ncbi:MAG: hypothetical protein N2C14_12370, partial [Planctomycetales bacterium]